jgi:1,2-diacylglycerol 3-alpha-glucosyltransferase
MPEKLKIAFYSDSFLPAQDGVVSSVLNFRAELQRRGHEVYVFASGNSRTKQMVRGDDRVFVVKSLKFSKYPQYNFAVFPYLKSRKVNEINMDIIHAHTPFFMGLSALVAGKLNMIPIVGTFHTMFTEKTVINEYVSSNRLLGGMIHRAAWPYARFFYNRCNLVTAPTGTIKCMLEKNGINNTVVVPNSVDTNRFSPEVDGSELRSRLLRSGNRHMVLYVGRLSKEKQLDTLLKAMRRLKGSGIEAVIVGTGPAEHHYRSMAKRLRLDNVRFAGFARMEELPVYYASCDVFCIPSIFETQGIVSLEAMASGKPVVGADYLALSELIKDGKNGEKFAPGDSIGCARKIEKVIYNMGSYNTMRKTAAEFSIGRATDKLLNTYYKAIDNMTVS